MKRTNSQPIADLLNSFFEDNPKMADKLAEVRLIDYWHSMNPMISRYTTDLFVKNRVLYVKLTSSVLKNELMLGKDNLINKLNEAVRREIIGDIRFIS